MIKIASIQLNSQNNLDDNLQTIAKAVNAAKAQGADLVVLPENACLMGRQAEIALKFDELCDFFKNLAKDCAVNLIAGTLPCPVDKNNHPLNHGKFFQTSLAFDEKGKKLARYDKIHLFKATVNDGVGSYDESLTFMAGEMPVLAEFMIHGEKLKVGMMICFDLRFPRLAQMYRMLGADILVVPSAFTHATGRSNWQMLLQARALDSQCLVVGSAQGGVHRTTNSERQTWGHSAIIGANGQVLASTERVEVGEEGFLLAIAEFDRELQEKIRTNLPIFNCHRLV